jgi:hypothetical protein
MADAKPFSDEEYKPYLPGTIEAIRDTANKNNQLVSSQLFRQVVNSLIATIAERDKRIEELEKELAEIQELRQREFESKKDTRPF